MISLYPDRIIALSCNKCGGVSRGSTDLWTAEHLAIANGWHVGAHPTSSGMADYCRMCAVHDGGQQARRFLSRVDISHRRIG